MAVKTRVLIRGTRSVFVDDRMVGSIKKESGFWNFYNIENERVFGVFGKTVVETEAALEEHFAPKAEVVTEQSTEYAGMSLGARVHHPKYGAGIVKGFWSWNQCAVLFDHFRREHQIDGCPPGAQIVEIRHLEKEIAS